MKSGFKIWAKNIRKRKENDEINIVSLCEHTNHLLENFNDLKKYIKPPLHKSIELAIILHDIGKVLPFFQIRKLGNKNYRPFDVEIEIEHSIFSVLLINKEELKSHIEDDDYTNFIISAVAYHHWRDKFEDLIRFGSQYFQKIKNKPEEFLNDLISNLREEMKCLKGFNPDLIDLDEFMLNGLAGGVTFDTYAIPPYQLYFLPQRSNLIEEKKRDWILIAGNLMRCDHFASFCEEDNEFYPIEIENISFEETIRNIKQKFNNKPIWQIDKIKNFINKNTILIAPTGIGKTEFAFLWANGKKLFYTLPIRAAVEQIFERAREIFNQGEVERVGILHSDADVYLINDDNEYNSIKLYDNARQLALAVNISTGDQFFPYALKPPGYEKIYSTFSYSHLVIDEVQAYEPTASAIIVKYIEDILKMGGKTLIMTATLPNFIKEVINDRLQSLNLTEPIILNLFEENKNTLRDFIKHKVQLIRIDNSTNQNNQKDFSFPEEIIKEIIQKGESHRVLVICNTIKQAQNVYNKIKNFNSDNVDLRLLHSRFTFNDRKNIQDILREVYSNPKPENEHKGKILVATQVIEAALDIDADILYTELAPMDALVQRMGRVLRRYREKYSYEGAPNVNIIFFDNGYESGNYKVYNNELLELTLILFFIKLFENADFTNFDNIIVKAKEYFEYRNNKLKIKDKFKDQINKIPILKINQKKSKKIKTLYPTDITFTLSEYDKYQFTEALYYLIDIQSKYKQEFFRTLSLLDAGYMAESRLEAQKIFRPMVTTSVISKNKLEALKRDLVDFFTKYSNTDRIYTLFKEHIISRYVVNILGVKERNPLQKFDLWIKENLEENKHDNLTDDDLNKLKRWMKNIYITDAEYSKEIGLSLEIENYIETRFF